jgi:hypothetical protein
MTKQLIEEERIASRAIYAALGERCVRDDKRFREGARVVLRQRAKIDYCQQGACCLSPPCVVQRITFNPRSHDHHCRMLRHAHRQLG